LLIDRSLERGERPDIVLIDAGYGNNTTFLKELEKRKLKYLGGVAKNRKVIIKEETGIEREIRLDELAKSLPSGELEERNFSNNCLFVSFSSADTKNL
jgi:SRSO17 transposase